MKERALCRALLLVLATSRLGHAQQAQTNADNDLKNRCADAYEGAQRKRALGQLLAAREASSFCAQADCPELLRKDCRDWTSQLNDSLPSIVVDARAADGSPLANLAIELDGATSLSADGRAYAVDPGRHELLLSGPGLRTRQQQITVLVGLREQIVRVTLDPSEPARRSFQVPRASYALGGVGVLALGGFTFFAVSGKSLENQLQECKPACAESRRAPIERDYLIADVSLGVGLVALGLSAWRVLSANQARPAPLTALSVQAGAGVAGVGYAQRF